MRYGEICGLIPRTVNKYVEIRAMSLVATSSARKQTSFIHKAFEAKWPEDASQ